jgi:hypothetical protein
MRMPVKLNLAHKLLVNSHTHSCVHLEINAVGDVISSTDSTAGCVAYLLPPPGQVQLCEIYSQTGVKNGYQGY